MIKLKTKHFTFLFLGILFFSISCSFFMLQALPVRNGNNPVELNKFSNMKASSTSFASTVNISIANASFFGEYNGDESGYSVVKAGDVNGDGYDDFLIGTYKNDDGGWEAGKAYLFYGGESRWGLNMNCSDANASFIGESGDYLGYGSGLAGAGDVNGDGYDDFIMGAHRNDDARDNAGKAYLFYGGESRWGLNTNCSEANATFLGEDASDIFGITVAGAGDVNNDGYDDLLIGAACSGNAGEAYLFYGGESRWGLNTNSSKANASFVGEYDDYNNELYVAGAGDVNGDGYDDFLLGDGLNNDGGGNAGKAYLFYGGDSSWLMETNCSTANASFIGEDSKDHIGEILAAGGDVNGDGYDDFLLSSYKNEEGGSKAGQTYLFFGGVSIWSTNTNCSEANASFIGQNEKEYSGYSIAGAGDFNNDGYDDLLIGGKGDDDLNVTGRIYLLLGRSFGWEMDTSCSKANITIMGKDKSEKFGSSVAFAGDINGDGSDDILGGAPNNSDEKDSAGKTYLILGEDYSVGGSTPQLIPGYNFYLVLGFLGFSILILTQFRKTNRYLT